MEGQGRSTHRKEEIETSERQRGKQKYKERDRDREAERENERERERARAQTPLSPQRMAEQFAFVIEKSSSWSNLTKDETSTLGTVLLESVESTVLAAFLKPSANGSQTIRTEHLGRTYPSHQGHRGN